MKIFQLRYGMFQTDLVIDILKQTKSMVEKLEFRLQQYISGTMYQVYQKSNNLQIIPGTMV